MRRFASILGGLLLSAALAAPATGQAVEYELNAEGDGWEEVSREGVDAEEALINECREMIADGRPSMARRKLDKFIEAKQFSDSPWLPEAYLLRGDAWVGKKDEYKALFDYEYAITRYPGSDVFVRAIEREYEIAVAYVHGLKRKSWGIRYEDASLIGEELLVRVQERLPGSLLAEKAGMELADYYFRQRDMQAASEAYELFMLNYPRSDRTKDALERRIYANISRFRGPKYDASGLIEARALLAEFRQRYPADARRNGLDEALDLRLEESEASQALTTARWYLRRHDQPSARFTLNRLLRDHPTTVAAAQAIDLMTERGWIAPLPDTTAVEPDGVAP